MSIALGALRNRTQLPDGSLVPWTSPLGKPMRIAATVPEFTWSDIAYALTPNGSSLDYVANAQLPGRRPPGRRPEAELEQLALRRGRGARLLRPARERSLGGHHGLEGADRHRRPVRRQPGGERDGRASSRPTTRPTTSTTPSRPPRRCWPTAGTTTCSRSTSRCATTTRSARSTRTRRSRCSTSTSATARAPGAISAADRAALTAAENAWLDYYVKGVGSEPADARGGVDILTSKCPVSGAGTRFHAPTWAQLAPGEVRHRRRRGADDRRARHRPEQRVHLGRRLHDHVQRRQRVAPRPTRSRRRRAPTRSPARPRSSPSSPSTAPTTWSPRASTTSTARPSG